MRFFRLIQFPSSRDVFELRGRKLHPKLRELRTKLAARRETSLLVLVTHDVNIRALTGQSLAPGEMAVSVLRDGRLAVLGRLDARAEADVAKNAVR